MKNYQEQIEEIRQEINNKIVAMLNKHDFQYEVTILGDTPVLKSNEYDENLTFTLDCVGIRNTKVYFEGSSSCESITLWADQIYVEVLIDLYEWLVDNEDEIFEEWDA